MRFMQGGRVNNSIDPQHAAVNEIGLGNRTYMFGKGGGLYIEPNSVDSQLIKMANQPFSKVARTSSYENFHVLIIFADSK
jgi:hypothetical protein